VGEDQNAQFNLKVLSVYLCLKYLDCKPGSSPYSSVKISITFQGHWISYSKTAVCGHGSLGLSDSGLVGAASCCIIDFKAPISRAQSEKNIYNDFLKAGNLKYSRFSRGQGCNPLLLFTWTVLSISSFTISNIHWATGVFLAQH
jgi:hypothetical protein